MSSVGRRPVVTQVLRSGQLSQAPSFATLYRRRRSGTPFSSCSPASSKAIPDPATRSFTVDETSTPLGSAIPLRPEPRYGRRPSDLVAIELNFPGVQSGPGLDARRTDRLSHIARAHRHSSGRAIERRGDPSPVAIDVGPRWRAISALACSSCAAKIAFHRASPTSAAFLVKPTTSVKSTVNRTRLMSGRDLKSQMNRLIARVMRLSPPATIRRHQGKKTASALGISDATYSVSSRPSASSHIKRAGA